MASPLRIAVIGLGTMAQSVHLPMLVRRHDRFEIAAIVDISERRRTEVGKKWHLGEEVRFESTADLVKAVRAKSVEVDAAVFAADGVKASDVLLLIQRGLPVLVEPPVGYGQKDIEQIAQFERMAGRPLVMVGYGELYDSSVSRFIEENQARDIRLLELETIMPASAVMYAKHHVTSAAYDVSPEKRSERRTALETAVEEGTGPGATQRDRDLYVKGLLTGLVAQLALVRHMFGPLAALHGVRQWPEQVTPGSIEVLGAVEGGPHVRIVWHYMPFAPEYKDTIRFVTTRRQGRVMLPAIADLDLRGHYEYTQKEHAAVVRTESQSAASVAYALEEAFFDFAARGAAPLYGVTEAKEDTAAARLILGEIMAASGRDIDVDPDAEGEDVAAPEPHPELEPTPLAEPAPIQAPEPIEPAKPLEQVKEERRAARENATRDMGDFDA